MASGVSEGFSFGDGGTRPGVRREVCASGSVHERRRLPVVSVAKLLRAQQSLTAVDRYSKHHDEVRSSEPGERYRALIPLERPRPGEQYAFEVDLDACTGCKSCVTACHTLNGLDEAETFRFTGLLHGGTPERPFQRTVTSSCHHCLDPACLRGCPVGAYEKDPVTGIVKHLDDQCFGCQYCTLMCPYDAPKFNEALGIVRKCDMCSARLAGGEAPACVQACPSEAIAVRVVERSVVEQRAHAGQFLAGAPSPERTLPATSYKSAQRLPDNLVPGDHERVAPAPAHPPLVVMLTLTQLGVGAFVLGRWFDAVPGNGTAASFALGVLGCVATFAGLVASVFHLGRPALAWRVVLGLRTSWLSREAVALGAFAKFALLTTLLGLGTRVPAFPGRAALLAARVSIGLTAGALGLAAVLSSIMVYVATGRAHWSASRTGARFFGTTLLLGLAAAGAVRALGGGQDSSFGTTSNALALSLLVTATAKLAFEALLLYPRPATGFSAVEGMGRLLREGFLERTKLRFLLGVAGGVALPLLLLATSPVRAVHAVAAVASLVLLTAGELLERYFFFAAAPPSRMPGNLR